MPYTSRIGHLASILAVLIRPRWRDKQVANNPFYQLFCWGVGVCLSVSYFGFPWSLKWFGSRHVFQVFWIHFFSCLESGLSLISRPLKKWTNHWECTAFSPPKSNWASKTNTCIYDVYLYIYKPKIYIHGYLYQTYTCRFKCIYFRIKHIQT